MPDTVIDKPAEQPKPFNAAEFIANRNAGMQPPKVEAKPAEATKPPVEVEHPETTPKLPRSVRREINGLRERTARAEGMLEAYKELGVKANGHAAPDVKTGDDPEPERKDFATDALYNRALGRWDARQEAKTQLEERDKKSGEQAADKEWESLVRSMEAKAAEDRKTFTDWDDVAAKAAEDDDAPVIKLDSQLFRLMQASEFQAALLYHFAKNPDELQKFIDLGEGPIMLRNFGRLEAKLEKMYTPDSTKQAAQAEKPAKEAPKDRSNPADAPKDAGRTAVDRDVHKPKPSAEVSARGGSAPPSEPAIGNKEWMAKRNRAQYGR